MLWEAQYGDFINGAQIILDEYLTSGRAKWGMAPSLVLLLPHGYEGQGPDHSSARLERFLNAAADTNMRIANCTTAAQYFHLLRRQALLLRTDPLPLVVMTPKSLLRHPFTASTPASWPKGAFQPVIDDDDCGSGRPPKVRRLALCSGKVAVDLLTSERRKDNPNVAVVRVEQLYPFPADAITEVSIAIRSLREVCWVQEEPENMGAWEFARPLLESIVDGRHPLRYIGRSRNSSPSEGRRPGTPPTSAPSSTRCSKRRPRRASSIACCRSRFNDQTAAPLSRPKWHQEAFSRLCRPISLSPNWVSPSSKRASRSG